ncbi:facilitated trehalose transporter Tret1 [Halyomorpha halys]|uniref:facilitated trehalose transporter Tret1 n=1 Tax=Halyomorpha halys TaxID=286706 RepID=UPI0006D4CA22|nr:facilitated trehalose transporter Tret1-like [Halyomorpha halys]XP_014286705.1 facilitated trehalose transporter Tret1-like [Halyomorpha halys]
MKHITFSPAELHLKVYVFSFACSLSTVMAGMALSWPSPLTAWYSSKDSEVPMTEHEVSWLVSISAIPAAVGSIPCGMLADIFGRKPILFAMGICSALSWLLILMTRSIWSLYVAQILAGLVLGGALSVAPIYISEISPPNIRGALSGQLITMFFVGQMIVYVAGPQLSYTNYITVCFSIPILFFILFFFAPESPYYLMSKGRDEEAKDCMTKLRGKDSVAELEASKKESLEKESEDKPSIWEVLNTNDYMKRMICLQVISCVATLNGGAAISVYAVEFMGQWVAVEMSIVFIVSSFFVSFLSDPIGRRPLLVFSQIGAAVCTSLLAAHFICGEKILLYIGLFGFCFIASVGINPSTMTLPSELFPTSLRAFANGLFQFTTNVCGFICVKIFININETLGIQYNFFLYTVVCLIGAAVGYLLPETAKSVISAS